MWRYITATSMKVLVGITRLDKNTDAVKRLKYLLENYDLILIPVYYYKIE